jgi:hypothetical protein
VRLIDTLKLLTQLVNDQVLLVSLMLEVYFIGTDLLVEILYLCLERSHALIFCF